MLSSVQHRVVWRTTGEGVGVGTKRPGRPWAPARGSCREINSLVDLMRGWLDGAALSVRELHKRLTPDHFVSGQVPELRKLRDQLAGEGLDWDLVEAVGDLCFPHASGEAIADLRQARELWLRSTEAPTLIAHPADTVPAAALLDAQERTIRVYEEMDRARQAYANSEQGRLQALQIATYLFGMLGQAHSKNAELRRRLDALQASPTADPRELHSAHRRLERSRDQENELRTELARAERERDIAQQVADVAARRIHELEEELSRVRDDYVAGGAPQASDTGALVPAPLAPGIDGTDSDLDAVDQVLGRVREALDREHESIKDAAEELGWKAAGDVGSSVVVPGEVIGRQPPTTARDCLQQRRTTLRPALTAPAPSSSCPTL